MEKLELKHLAPYLPYGLNVEHTSFSAYGQVKSIDLISAISADWVSFFNSCDYFFDDSEPECDIQPILRPLSDLTKEIEVNGERFVPAERLYEGSIWSWKNDREYYRSFYEWITSFDLHDIPTIEFEKATQLIEWHFDVFGLIDAGLAIDINTIEDVRK